MSRPHVFGAGYSVYVRIVRLALEEKGVAYRITPIDVFAPGGPPPAHLARHPFGRIPAFEHGEFRLYETGAIARYVDEAFEGPALQPADPRERARVNQILSIADNYLYPTLVLGVYVEGVARRLRGETPNQARLEAALRQSPVCLKALADLMDGAAWLGGGELTLADLYVAPMVSYFVQSPEGREMMSAHVPLMSWWAGIEPRDSMRNTSTKK